MKTKQLHVARYALATVLGAAATLGVLWLAAWGVGESKLPDGYLSAYAGTALFLGALVAGACAPATGGRRIWDGLIVGCALAALLILSKLLAEQEAVFGIHTWISVAICLVGGGLGSCIFHKRLRRNTRSKPRRRHRK